MNKIRNVTKKSKPSYSLSNLPDDTNLDVLSKILKSTPQDRDPSEYSYVCSSDRCGSSKSSTSGNEYGPMSSLFGFSK